MTGEQRPYRGLLTAAGVLGFAGVALGAWSAHGLGDVLVAIYGEATKEVAGETLLARHKAAGDFETGVRYQLVHAVALLALAGLPASRLRTVAGSLMTVGAVIFSGSLYLLVLLAQPRLGAVTPIGGVLLLAGWACVLAMAVRTTGDPGDASSAASSRGEPAA